MNWGQATAGTPTSGASTSAFGVSWLTSLLPNLDSGSLYSGTSLSQPGFNSTITGFYSVGYQNSGMGIDNIATGTTIVNTFLCPSDTQRGTIKGQALTGSGGVLFATTNYKACAGSNWVASDFGAASSGTRGRNSANTDGLDHGNGVICRGGGPATVNVGGITTPVGAPIVTTMMDIRDGASKTFLVGESVPAWCPWSLWFWFEGSTATCGIPLNFRVSAKPPLSTPGRPAGKTTLVS